LSPELTAAVAEFVGVGEPAGEVVGVELGVGVADSARVGLGVVVACDDEPQPAVSAHPMDAATSSEILVRPPKAPLTP
jgi:hypothetical protein